jgi:hypothetical protein
VDEASDVLLDFGAADGRLLVFGDAVLDHGIGMRYVNVDEVVLSRCQSVFDQ